MAESDEGGLLAPDARAPDAFALLSAVWSYGILTLVLHLSWSAQTATAAMTIAPEPSTSRGDITLQPGYFTSSLYVEPLREDLRTLTKVFAEQYETAERPFELFKRLWSEQGWCWLHLRVYDGRGRQAFLRNTERVFVGTSRSYSANNTLTVASLERLASTEPLLNRVVALFALYTFHNSQPSSSAPPIYALPHIAIPIGVSCFAISRKL